MSVPIHATAVAIGTHAVLLTGASGSGKSDLALRLIDRGAVLIADDRTIVTVMDDIARAACPATIRGLIEVRGVGIVRVPYREDLAIALVVALDGVVERLPEPRLTQVAGVAVPLVTLHGYEVSAPLKVEYALAEVVGR